MGYGHKKQNICNYCKKNYFGYGDMFCSNKCKGASRKATTIKNGIKNCNNCKKNIDISQFYLHKINGYSAWCKDCCKKQVKNYKEKNVEKIKILREKYKDVRKKVRKPSERKYYLKSKYGISELDYKEMYDKQRGMCILCDKSVEYKKLHIDHCHTLGHIRGLLCSNCNLGIGNFKENINTLKKAIIYLSTPAPLKYSIVGIP